MSFIAPESSEKPILGGGTGSDFFVEITNKDNRYYSSLLQFGSPFTQNISLVYDSQTDWTIVLSKSCSTCTNETRYDEKKSNTSKPSEI